MEYLLCTSYCSKYSTCVASQHFYKIFTIVIPILQMTSLRNREVRKTLQVMQLTRFGVRIF